MEKQKFLRNDEREQFTVKKIYPSTALFDNVRAWAVLPLKDIFDRLEGSAEGLSERIVSTRRAFYGANTIEQKENWRLMRLLSGQFADALVWVLLGAALLAFIFGEFRDATIIALIVAINATIGFLQEFKAERVLASMRRLVADTATVLRDGTKHDVDTRSLVPGDCVVLTSGDNVPADGVIISSSGLRVVNAVFTGEAQPKMKKEGVLAAVPSLATASNILFAGETVVGGSATMIVVATGMQTELGHLATLAQTTHEDATPLQKRMKVLSGRVFLLSMLVGALVVSIGQSMGMPLYANILFALALAVSVVPEGLPAAISVALSFGMRRLLKKNVLAKRLTAVETLGSVEIICTDKTGTLTSNAMTVAVVCAPQRSVCVSGHGFIPKGSFTHNGQVIVVQSDPAIMMILRIGALCTGAALEEENGSWRVIGDPTEGALLVAAQKVAPLAAFTGGWQKTHEASFTSERMRMSVVCRTAESSAILFVKGSPDRVLPLCTHIVRDGAADMLNDAQRSLLVAEFARLSSEGLRVLGFAYRPLDTVSDADTCDDEEHDLVWVGMVGMIDRPRDGVRDAIAQCRAMGIRVVMITGDHPLTAAAIARDVGLIADHVTGRVISGEDIAHMSPQDIVAAVESDAIFARVAPDEKLRIADALKSSGRTIAMTGDGVNDAPALKRADIGVAMGVMGTDVTKESADMILLDDDFSSIVAGVREGRTIFSNLQKFVYYVFTSNASELFTVAAGVVAGVPAPITAVQILAIDLGTDLFPSFALSFEREEKKQLHAVRAPIMSWRRAMQLVIVALIMAAGAIAAFTWSLARAGWDGATIPDGAYAAATSAAYATLALTQMANVLHARSFSVSPHALGFFSNKVVMGAIGISITMLLVFLYAPPVSQMLGFAPIAWQDWIVVGISTLMVYAWETVRKWRGWLVA